MPAHDTSKVQTLEEVDQLIRETRLCESCASLFCERTVGQQYPHHESYTSLCQSLEAGCRLCVILKGRWDFEADRQVSEAEWHSTACFFGTAGDTLRINICSRKSLIYVMSFKVHEYRPSSNEVPGPISNKEYMHTASNWFKSCTSNTHSMCNAYRGQQDRKLSRPLRLLQYPSDQSEKVQLVEVQKDKYYRYATLSHRWGVPEPPKLTRKGDGHRGVSYNTIINGISVSNLPRIFREALQMIHHFKLEYLWIDSLCINQDNDINGRKQEWEEEALKIGDIYSGGVFNIAAIDSRNSDGALFPEKRDFFAPVVRDFFGPHGQPKSSSRVVGILPDCDEEFDRQVLSSELLSRGWVCQEVILAPANLFCTAQQMWWLCHGHRESQNRSTDFVRLKASNDRGEATLALARLAIAGRTAYWSSMNKWGKLLRLYCKTSVTFKDDRLAAIAGLSKVFKSWFHQDLKLDSYHSGVWSTDLIFQLHWHTTSSKLAPKRYTADHFIPSWSPVSCTAEIDVAFRYETLPFELPIEWTMNTSGLDSFGRARSIEQGMLHLRCVPIDMTLVSSHGKYEAAPSSHTDLRFEIRWDNQAEIDLADNCPSGNALRALILSATAWSPGQFTLRGILIRSFRDDDLTKSDKWVRCGYLMPEDGDVEKLFKVFQLIRYGIKWVENEQGYLKRVSTGVAPNLEDVYLV